MSTGVTFGTKGILKDFGGNATLVNTVIPTLLSETLHHVAITACSL